MFVHRKEIAEFLRALPPKFSALGMAVMLRTRAGTVGLRLRAECLDEFAVAALKNCLCIGGYGFHIRPGGTFLFP